MNIEHNDYSNSNEMILDKIRLLNKIGIDSKWSFILNKTTVLSSDQIQIKNSEIILTNLKIPMRSSFELEFLLGSPLMDSMATFIDCSIQNDSISQIDCESKGCVFQLKNMGAPRCHIPENKGGYVFVNSTNSSEQTFFLKKNDDISLFGEKEIQDLSFQVTHGNVGNFHATRIKVFCFIKFLII
jgi:hypothetical protein